MCVSGYKPNYVEYVQDIYSCERMRPDFFSPNDMWTQNMNRGALQKLTSNLKR